MSTEQLVIAILSSSVIGGTIGAVIAGRFNLRVKDRGYEHDYYKLVIAKRIAAYESIQQLITSLKTAVIDDDRLPYHILLSHKNGLLDAHTIINEISSHSLWLSDDLFQQTRNISILLTSAPSYEDGIVAFAKKHYQQLATFRESIELLHNRDMLTLHEVNQFLKTKKVSCGFESVQIDD